ncbi:hypothetical protein ACFL0U_01720 [Pseudomonadota bacterium]
MEYSEGGTLISMKKQKRTWVETRVESLTSDSKELQERRREAEKRNFPESSPLNPPSIEKQNLMLEQCREPRLIGIKQTKSPQPSSITELPDPHEEKKESGKS